VNILSLNAGSSSLKFRMIRMESSGNQSERARGLVEKWGTPQAAIRLEVGGQVIEARTISAETAAHAAEHAIEVCRQFGIDAIGHRVVHGGWQYSQATRITPQVVSGIREAATLAPLHNELALSGIEAGLRLLPTTPAVAVFDTGFHRTIPDVAVRYAIPIELADKHHLRRYGFHGISHQYVSELLLRSMNRPATGSRLITCHLGNGASVCAIRDGQSVDTSMGFTPMEGLMMGTRSGDIDPGLVLHLMSAVAMSAAAIDELLNRQSGLRGISGRSQDMRDQEEAAGKGDARSRLALEMFAYRVRKYIGAYTIVLGGVDAVAFAGGIGEHSGAMRARICAGLWVLGIEIDGARNNSASGKEPCAIHSAGSSAEVWVIPTDEERQIAKEVFECLSKA
jgi:acetate kinase